MNRILDRIEPNGYLLLEWLEILISFNMIGTAA